MPQIIETTANRLYAVEDTGNADLAHVWFGIEVKRAAGEAFIPKAKARKELVRREGSRIVADAV